MTLQTDRPITFWEILDRLCDAADLRREFPPISQDNSPFRPPFDGLPLVPGRARPPACDTGAFRVELLRVRHRRERDYGNDNGDFLFPIVPGVTAPRRNATTGAIDRSSYAADLLVSAEPRMRIFKVGEVENATAVDDHGRSLLRVPSARRRTTAALPSYKQTRTWTRRFIPQLCVMVWARIGR